MRHTIRGLLVSVGVIAGLYGCSSGPSMQSIADKWVGASQEEVTSTLGEPVRVIKGAEEGVTIYRYTTEGVVAHGPVTTYSPSMTTGRAYTPTGESFGYTAMGTQMNTNPSWNEPIRCVLDLWLRGGKVIKAVGSGC
jgi:hypothetical protein